MPLKYAKGYGNVLHGSIVPSEDLQFPPGANFTAVELLTFFPLSLKSHNVVYRFATNGCSRNILWTVIDHSRSFERPWHINSCGEMIYQAMRGSGYDKWTFKSHETWHNGEVAKAWNGDLITVPDIKVPSAHRKKEESATPIQFRALANGVKAPPQGSDALDLTRMVHYALEHPNERWLYPDQYAELLQRIGGPQEVVLDNTDKYVFERWAEKLKKEATCAAPKIATLPLKQVPFTANISEPNDKHSVPCIPQAQGRKGRGRPPKSAMPGGVSGRCKVPNSKSMSQGFVSPFLELDADVTLAEAGNISTATKQERRRPDTILRLETKLSDQSFLELYRAYHTELYGGLPEAGETFFDADDADTPFESAATLLGGEGWWMEDTELPNFPIITGK
ncbi:hypothetical protein K491DRAFT_689200 [Lophiostoma macrostomum CBS 122681]|uniref:Uncharacterized protein n=1 Tax=Lophiostoma macrostomum CBS 122681 TaxID=1314788 RepID=A0A6A6TJX4_9PLEO|nr:hypothetical protein K491DRAFT_689200 [Lophiostoma macrostomum CBS 122681]